MQKKSEKSQKKHLCEVCDKVIIGNNYNFNSHMYQHGVVRPRFKCSYCPKEYYRRDVYDRHIGVHQGIIKKLFVCDHCERGFVDKRNLILHLKIHDDLHIQPNILQFTCTACDATYCEKRLLKYHIRKHHFNLHDKETHFHNKKLNETWVERVKESEEFVEITKINNNVLKIKKCQKIKNEDEKEVYKEKSELKKYLCSIFATKENTQYSKAICDYCNKEMLKKSLKSHIRERHLKLRRFKCKDCNENFSRHYQMVNHICGKYKRRCKNERC